MPLSIEAKEMFDSYRNQAMQRLRDSRYRHRPTVQDIAQIWEIVSRHYVPEGILRQINYDLRVYKLYDAIAMWLDPVAGLAPYAPEMFEEIAKAFLTGQVR